MSLILDALSRAEREKREQASTAPDILSQELAAPQSAKDARIGVLLVGVAILIVATASLLYVVLRDSSTPSVPAGAGSPADTPAAKLDSQVVSDDSKMLFATAGPDAQPVSGQTEGQAAERRTKASMDLTQSSQAVAALYSLSSNEAAADSLEASDTVSVESVTQQDSLPEAQPVAEDVIDVEQVLREMRARNSVDTLESHPAPLLKNLTKQFRDRVPTLMYSRHDYNTAGTSSVTINGETLNPTQRTRGVEVREILSNSVILRFEGADFRLKSLNSWVNL
ncbi:general secretion pathway protein GspB [Congregibacter sp.]|uniref:general secretion pathway protein GspB n=1 Tax=Congregibacter sp. TaxID=2744308 RepID=UPI0039E51491